MVVWLNMLDLLKKYASHEAAVSLYIHTAIREQYFNTRQAEGICNCMILHVHSGQTTLNI